MLLCQSLSLYIIYRYSFSLVPFSLLWWWNWKFSERYIVGFGLGTYQKNYTVLDGKEKKN